VIAETLVHPPSNEYVHGGEPWLIVSPEHAEIFRRAGMSKADVKRRLWELSKMPASMLAVKEIGRAHDSRQAEFGGAVTADTVLGRFDILWGFAPLYPELAVRHLTTQSILV
jgi:hypothetical protein